MASRPANSPLQEDLPPPVPPKDTPYLKRNMDLNVPPSAPASGSKRKRTVQEDRAYYSEHEGEEFGDDGHTPKRTRASTREQTEHQPSTDSTPAKERTIRRKKKSNNLSNLNLRHAAAQHARRESKFQEGSLTDKPSEEPPRLFTRFGRTESGNIKQVDDLMADYHDGVSSTCLPAESGNSHGKTGGEIDAKKADGHVMGEQTDSGGFFRFGRTFAAGLHPITLWNKLWNETKEELKRQDMEEAERKRKLKEEAEKKYAELKETGQLPAKFVSRPLNSTEASTPRDSGIEMEDVSESIELDRHDSKEPTLVMPNQHELMSTLPGEAAPGTFSKPKTLASRLHLKKPSLTNIKLGFKRTASEMNLRATVDANRDSSSSASPMKHDFGFEPLTLRKSSSRFDMRKQQKLSKRVSDLESKLQQARRELDEAIQVASPMPKLNGRYERFTPSSTVRSRRFVPGTLPTLPSERLFSAEQMGFATPRADAVVSRNGFDMNDAVSKSNTITGGELSPLKSEISEDANGEETLRAMKGGRRQYPPRADSIFQHDNANIEGPGHASHEQHLQSDLTDISHFNTDSIATADGVIQIDNAHLGEPVADSAAELLADHPTTNDSPQAPDQSPKQHKKNANAKKRRKSAKHKAEDSTYKPGKEAEDDDDDTDLTEDRPKKKSKGGRKKIANNTSPKAASPHGNATKIVLLKLNDGARASVEHAQDGEQNGESEYSKVDSPNEKQEEYSEDGDALYNGNDGTNEEIDASVRVSMDSQALDPVYEEEEDTIAVATKANLTKATSNTKSACSTLRTRSRSPSKQIFPAGAEERVMTKAAHMAKEKRLVEEQASAGAAVRGKGSFEWPDDVF